MKILDEPSVVAWLNEFAKASTKKQYESRIVRFLQSTHTTTQDLKDMDVKQIKQLFLNYQREQVEKGCKNNGILSIITAIRSYLISIDKTVDFRKGQLVNLESDTNSHIFSNGDIKLLFDVGDTFEKALLATAVSEGWEISAFLEEQDRKVVENRLAHAIQNGDKFIFFNNTRQKTGKARFCVLNPLAIEWLTKYLQVRKDSDERLFPITADGVQKMLYRLAEQAGLKTTGNLRFHNIRKWLMSRLSRCSFNQFQIKYLMGKSIGLSDSTYLQTLQSEIEEKYPIVYNDYLNISAVIGVTAANKQLEELKIKIDTNNRIVEALVKDLTNKDKEFRALRQEFIGFKGSVGPLIELAEKQVNVYIRARDLHAETAPKLEAKGSPLAKQSRESEAWLRTEADKLEKQLQIVREKLKEQK